ncbi:MAG: hypothetical protein V7L00_23245 [Nostoc sp.]|uniref:hypothetical protein n=1 Tax=Nostoc sp. TaxID=1180 RepID=UPI002FF7EB2F
MFTATSAEQTVNAIATSLKERELNKMQNFILYLASLSFIRRGIEGEVILDISTHKRRQFTSGIV